MEISTCRVISYTQIAIVLLLLQTLRQKHTNFNSSFM